MRRVPLGPRWLSGFPTLIFWSPIDSNCFKNGIASCTVFIGQHLCTKGEKCPLTACGNSRCPSEGAEILPIPQILASDYTCVPFLADCVGPDILSIQPSLGTRCPKTGKGMPHGIPRD